MFDKIKIIGTSLAVSSPNEVISTEEQLGVNFPSGYSEYMMRFGEGVLGGSYIRIYLPKQILLELLEWSQRINEYWFWDEGKEILSKDEALECIIIGDTLDGGELIVHPSDFELIYVLPRYNENIYVAGRDLQEAIEWLCGSGVLTEPFQKRNFEPFIDAGENA